jgi:hypothetical protein
MYALPVQNLPKGNEWLYEVKFDGYRCLAGRDASGVPKPWREYCAPHSFGTSPKTDSVQSQEKETSPSGEGLAKSDGDWQKPFIK